MDGPVPVVAPVAVVNPVRGCGSGRPVGVSYTAKDSSPMDSPVPRKAPVAAVDLQWVLWRGRSLQSKQDQIALP